MKVLVTGGGGFVGAMLARRLLADGEVTVAGSAEPVDELVVLDIVPPPDDLARDARVRVLTGSLDEQAPQAGECGLVFHLAGVVSGAAEADFDLGLATNLDGTRALLEACRAWAGTPVVVFSSSLAVFGVDPAFPPQEVIRDDTLPRPQSSYGVQKFIGEQLVADYGRKGFLDGRSVRLMTVTVRPGKPNAAASSFLSGIVREPLAGEPGDCPVDPDTPVAVSSPGRTVEALLRAAGATRDEWGSRTAFTLPGLTTTPREMVAALAEVAGDEVASRVRWTHDDDIERLVVSWPARFESERAAALGLSAPSDFQSIVREYLEFLGR